MHSIRVRITVLIVSAILLCSTLIGTISIFTVKGREEQSSEQLMNTICQSNCDKINNYLNGIENSVETFSRYVYGSLDVVALWEGGVIGANGSGRSLRGRDRTAAQQAALDDYLVGHLAQSEVVFENLCSNNPSIMGYYYRINPELSESVPGYWFTRSNGVRFQSREVTDVNQFRPDDFSHVGWFYQTLERGRPSWQDPYVNGNLGLTVISYTMPLYKSDTLIGVIGIDLQFETLVEQIQELRILESGYAFLTDKKGKIIYHPQMEEGVLLSEVNAWLSVAQNSESTALMHYALNGQEREAAWGPLSNGLRLIVSAPASEINAGWLSLRALVVATAITTITVFIVLTLWIMRKITDPLAQLVQASWQISEGNYNVELVYTGDDEIGILTSAFQQMANHIRVFIRDLNSKAFRDPLTGVRNKAAFDVVTMELDENLKSAAVKDEVHFAMLMFDCNNLKRINDTFGHEKGDIYLQTACALICTVYAHSPVFRIGGDEFVVILQGEDLKNQTELEQRFDQSAARINAEAANDWERVDIARGAASHAPHDEDTEAVFRRADKRMYENKKRTKQAAALLAR